MTSTIHPIFAQISSQASGVSQTGANSSTIGKTGQAQDGEVFSDVLGTATLESLNQNNLTGESFQSATDGETQILLNPLANENILEIQAPTLVEGEEVLVALETVENPSLNPSQDLSGLQKNPTTGEIPVKQEGQIIPRVANGQVPSFFSTSRVPHGVAPNTVNPSLAHGEEVVQGHRPLEPVQVAQDHRIAPLLNASESSRASAVGATFQSGTISQTNESPVQQLLSQIETSSNRPLQINGGQTIVPTILPPPREDLSAITQRLEHDTKPSGTIGISQSGEAGVGGGNSGLTFGNPSASAQGQFFESSPGYLTNGTQGQSGVKATGFEERLHLLNTSVPHRLQVDVQLSDTARVQVDIGVQQRQVYAGLLMDNPMLRSVASQNVQELEQQLGEVEMELEEFDVHGENQQSSETFAGDGLGQQHEREAMGGSQNDAQGKISLARDGVRAHHDRGWHVVA